MWSSYSTVREIYLIFMDDISYPFSSFIKKGFKHVFAIERTALGWYCIDPNRSEMSVIPLPAKFHVDIMPEFIRNNPHASILKLSVELVERSAFPRVGLISCVSSIQYYLGVWWPLTLTPYQLYNRMIKKPPHHIRAEKLCQAAKEHEGKRKRRLREVMQKQKSSENKERN